MNVRPYRASDFRACVDIFKSNIPKFFLAQELSACEEFFEKYAHESFWILEQQGAVVACGGVGVRGSEGRMRYGMVSSAYHKCGLGSYLVLFRLRELLMNSDVSAISLDTSHHNPDFFRRFGFEEILVTTDGYGVGLHRHDMRWILPKTAAVRERISAEMLKQMKEIEIRNA